MITNATLSFCLSQDIRLEEIHRIFPNSAQLQPVMEPDQKTYTVNINSLQINESSCFGIKMILPARASGPVTEAKISLKYDIPFLKIEDHTEECEITIEYTNNRDLCSKIDREVISYFNQLNVENLVNQAINETKVGNVAGATKILIQAQLLTQKIGNDSLTNSINQATVELNNKGGISPDIVKTMRVGSSHTVKIDNPNQEH